MPAKTTRIKVVSDVKDFLFYIATQMNKERVLFNCHNFQKNWQHKSPYM